MALVMDAASTVTHSGLSCVLLTYFLLQTSGGASIEEDEAVCFTYNRRDLTFPLYFGLEYCILLIYWTFLSLCVCETSFVLNSTILTPVTGTYYSPRSLCPIHDLASAPTLLQTS